MKPLCFVLMPFGVKPTVSGRTIDFDRVYAELIRPAVERSRLEPIRADEEVVGGIVHKPMFERLLLCDHTVADLTTANATGKADYWDHATLLELAALDDDQDAAIEALADARAATTEQWMFDTTADTLRAIGERTGSSWIHELEAELRHPAR